MARNDNRYFRTEDFERTQQRAGVDTAAESWRALASITVASMLAIAVVIGAFTLIDAVVSTPPSLLARKAPASSKMPSRRACVLPPDKDLSAPMQVDPALLVTD
ncbi:MAG: hypothetical protein GEU95_03180 [Rhizobiales bacterium]|nr:hypothetical protein [Hyphomicrobiales bacterium]